LEESGDLTGAVSLLRQAIAEIDPAEMPQLAIYARHNLITSLAVAGQHQEASQLLPESIEIFSAHAKPLDLLRLGWPEGKVAFGLGEMARAEGHFRHVQQEFLHRGMAYDAALVSLDLALVLAQEGRNDELRHLALEIIPIFEAQDVYREALAAMLMFQNACKEDRLTVELVHHIASLLEQSRQPKGRVQNAES